MTPTDLEKLRKKLNDLKSEALDLQVKKFGAHAKLVCRAIAVAEKLYVEVKRGQG